MFKVSPLGYWFFSNWLYIIREINVKNLTLYDFFFSVSTITISRRMEYYYNNN
jgi:hypothetical protein